jgi:3-phytase
MPRLLWAALLLLPSDPVSVKAIVETEPVPNAGDAADDPAIWIHPSDPGKSRVLGTDKKGGLAVYDLAGKQVQYLKDGKINNVDVRQGVPWAGKSADFAIAGNRSDNSIAIYRVDGDGRLEKASGRALRPETELYGSCLYRSAKSGKLYFLLTSKDGVLEQWELFDDGRGGVDGRKVRSFDVGGQCEGCVADDELGRLYVGEEEKGIWRYAAEPDGGEERTLVDGTGGRLVADVEGLAIWRGRGGTGYLLASSQGNDTFAVYRREGKNEFVGTFRIAGGPLGAVEECDGIDVTSAALGGAFPEGLFVAQDGKNGGRNQNFKFVAWGDLARAFDPPLATDPGK